MSKVYDENTELTIKEVLEQRPELDRESLLKLWNETKPHFGGRGFHRYMNGGCCYCGRPENWNWIAD